MLHPLQRKIVALQRRGRMADAVRGLCIVVAAVLFAIVALGAIDYLVRIQDRGVRIIFSLSALGVLGWTSYRFLGKCLFVRPREVDYARLIERTFPELRNRLVSAVQFLREADDDPTAGSAALRRAVIEGVETDARSVDFTAVLDRRRPLRAAALLAAACLLAGVPIALTPTTAQTALARIGNPLGHQQWPRTTHLEIRRPVERVARGGTFQVEAVDARGSPLPSEILIHYRLEGTDGTAVEETEPMQLVAGAAVARRDDIQRPFSYRVECGDDRTMPWREVEVVEPPAIESVSIRLIPPAYTGLPATNAERHIRALRGTRVQISAKADRPLAAASLCLENGTKIPAEISADGLTFSIGDDGVPFVVEKSGSYWFELTDREGLRSEGDRWEIQAVADAPPTVVIERPTADLIVTPEATVPIGVAAKDDLAVARIELVYRLDESEPERRSAIFAGPEGEPISEGDSSPLKKCATAGSSSSAGEKSGENTAGQASSGTQTPEDQLFQLADSRTVDYRWNLAPLALRPGMKVQFFATADDYLPQSGKSDPRRLIVVSADELLARLAGRVKLIAAELRRALDMQQGCRERIEALRSSLADSQRPRRTDLDRLQAAEHAQREVDLLLSGGGEGLPRHVRALLTDMDNNRVENPILRGRMASLLDELGRLERQRLTAIGRELAAAVKSVRIDLEGQGGLRRVADSLAAAVENQNAVIATLELWIDRLTRSDGYGRFHLQLGLLLLDQQDVAERTAAIGRRTLARQLRDLPPQDAAKLGAAAAAQLELAQRTDRLLQEYVGQVDNLSYLDEIRRRAVAATMLAVADRIRLNQVGQAAAGQKRIVRDLREILGLAADRGRTETSTGDSIGESKDDRQETPTESRAENGRPGTEPGKATERKSPGRKADMERTRARMMRLWGELPPHVREQMLQSPVEDFPPKYELMIEEYFRRLAEERGEMRGERGEKRKERGGKDD